MTIDQAQDVVMHLVTSVAPEIDPDTVGPSTRLREDLDLDSLDFLNLVEAIQQETGISVPESDYPLIGSIGGLASYLAAHT